MTTFVLKSGLAVSGFKTLEGASRICDWVFHGRVRLIDPRFHADCHLSGPGLHEDPGWVSGFVDVDWRRRRWIYFWHAERPFRTNPSTDMDHSGIRRVHRTLRLGERLLGPGCVPSYCWA